METVLDIKNALKDIPDKLLGSLSFSCGEGCEEQISMVAPEGSEEDDYPQVFELIDKKYPQLNDLNHLIQNIAKAQGVLDEQENDDISERIAEEPITSEFFDKKK